MPDSNSTDQFAVERKVFLDYSQAELDRNYDQQASAPNAATVIGGYSARSEEVRRTCKHATHAYGSHTDEVLDFFPASAADAPTLIFVHGGAWRNGTKNDYSFVAQEFVRAGIHCIVLNFSKLPAARLPAVAAQLQRALIWIVGNQAVLGIDPGKLYLCGHSSGAHLSATLIVTDWTKLGFASHPIKGATLISGAYDLKPVLLSARRSYVLLDENEEEALSPIRHVRPRLPSILVAYAENDTAEFRRHSVELAAALQPLGCLARVACFDGLNHFEIMAALGQPQHALPRMVAEHVWATCGIKKSNWLTLDQVI